MKQPFVLVNALAAGVARDPETLIRLGRLVSSDNLRVTHSPQEVEPALLEAAAAGVETLVIVGGDGSVTGTLTPLLRSWPNGEFPSVVLAGGGRLNQIAHALGTCGSPDAILARLLDADRAPRSVRRRVLKIQPAALGTRYGFTLCVGFPARWLAESGQTSGRGPAGGLFVTARAVGSALLGGELSRELFAPIDAEIWLDGESAETESITGLVAGTSAEPGLPVRPLSPTEPEHECFQLAITRTGPAVLGLAAALQGLGLDGAALASDEREVRSLEIRFGDRTAYAVDTDALPATGVLRVELGPALRFLSP